MWVEVDPASPSRVVQGNGPDGQAHEQYLEWDRTLDDEGNLRRCPACSCEDLYRRSTAPPVTGFLMVVLVGLICLLLWGVGDAPIGLVISVMVTLAFANVLIVMFAKHYLACYRCESRFFDVGIPRGRHEWDASIAERYRPRPPRKVEAEETAAERERTLPGANRGDLA